MMGATWLWEEWKQKMAELEVGVIFDKRKYSNQERFFTGNGFSTWYYLLNVFTLFTGRKFEIQFLLFSTTLGTCLRCPTPPPNPLKDFQFPLSWGCSPMSPPYSKLLTIKTQEWPWVSDFKHKKLLHTQMTLLKLFLINHPSQHFAINSIHFCEAQQRECFYNLVLLRRHCLLVLLHLGLFVHWSKNYLPFHSLKSVRRKFWKKNQA